MVKRAAELSRLDINRNWTAGILFLTDRVMAKYNAEFLQHSGTTDVITFSYLDDGYGDDGDTAVELAIGVEVAWREGCQRANSSYPEELTLYIVHGLLHAAGEDDLNPPAKRRMRRREHQVMTQLKKEFNLNEIFPEIRNLSSIINRKININN
jgi:probable rRNA maturation factor